MFTKEDGGADKKDESIEDAGKNAGEGQITPITDQADGADEPTPQVQQHVDTMRKTLDRIRSQIGNGLFHELSEQLDAVQRSL